MSAGHYLFQAQEDIRVIRANRDNDSKEPLYAYATACAAVASAMTAGEILKELKEVKLQIAALAAAIEARGGSAGAS